MKQIILFFASIAIVCLIVSCFNKKPQYQISPREKVVNTAIGQSFEEAVQILQSQKECTAVQK